MRCVPEEVSLPTHRSRPIMSDKNKRAQSESATTRLATANQVSHEVKALKDEVDELKKMFKEFMAKANQPIVHWVQEPTGPIREQPVGSLSNQEQQNNSEVIPQTVDLQKVQLQHISIMTPPTFDGDSSEAIAWLIDYKEVVAINKWDENDSLNYVRQALTNAAKAWYRSIWFESRPNNWQQFEEEFKTAFLRNNASDSLRARLRKLKQTKDMDPLTYYFKTMELCAMIDRKMSDRDRIDQVIDNLQPDIRSAVRMRDPQTIIELQRAIKLWIADHPHDQTNQQPSKANRKPNDDRKSQGGYNNKDIKTNHSRDDHWCLNCGKKGHYPRECPQPYNAETINKRREEWRQNPPFKNRSRNQDVKGKTHAVIADEAVSFDDSSSVSYESQSESSSVCYEEPQVGAINHKLYTLYKSSNDHDRMSCITCKVNGKTVGAILDTGASLSVLPYDLVRSTNTPLYKWKGSSLGLANGKNQVPLGWCEASIEYEDRIYTVHAVVLKQAPDILLGEDYIKKSGMVISYHDNVITYLDKYMQVAARYLERVRRKDFQSAWTQTADTDEAKSSSTGESERKQTIYYVEYCETPHQVGSLATNDTDHQQESQERVVSAECNVLTPPKPRAHIQAKTFRSKSEDPLWIEPRPNGAPFVVPGISRRSRHVVDVLNVHKEPIQIYKNDIIARATLLDASRNDKPKEQNTELTAQQQQEGQFRKLLDQYDDLFVTQDANIGIVPFVKHVINTGDADQIRSKPYRVSLSEQQVIKKLRDAMLEAGVLRPSRSHWASPVVLVKKKGSSNLRFCADYRNLNRVTKVDPYPIPNMEAVLETLSSNHWFSKLDIKAMYWQVSMDKDSRQKTAFVVHCGHDEFNVMPFGLVATPVTAMRVMNQILEGMEKNSFVFYDDILVYTPTFESHLKALELLFKKLKEANVTLNRDKCELLMRSVTYLGHIVTPKGKLPDPTKIESIVAFKTPTNITQARSFIGICDFFRRYIRRFSTIAKPIYDTIKVKQALVWTDEAQTAMEELQRKLTTPPQS